MSSSASTPDPRWWQRRGPSLWVFVGVLVVMAVASVAMWSSISGVLGDIGEDRQGVDPWEDPIGVERVGEVQVARLPNCAAAPLVRIELWDEESEPYWAVEGPPTPMASFFVGVTPQGWTEVTPFTEPPSGATLRLMVVRKVKGIAGVRYQRSDLRTGYVASGEPISRYGVEDFVTGDVCGDGEGDGSGSSTTTSTTTA